MIFDSFFVRLDPDGTAIAERTAASARSSIEVKTLCGITGLYNYLLFPDLGSASNNADHHFLPTVERDLLMSMERSSA